MFVSLTFMHVIWRAVAFEVSHTSFGAVHHNAVLLKVYIAFQSLTCSVDKVEIHAASVL